MGQYGPPHGEYFPPEMDPYYHSYESQDPSWGGPVRKALDKILFDFVCLLVFKTNKSLPLCRAGTLILT